MLQRCSNLDLGPSRIGPIHVKMAAAWLVNALEGVGAKVVALGLE